MTITQLSTITDIAKTKNKSTIAVAAAEDKNVLLALKQAHEQDIAIPLLFGNRQRIQTILDEIQFHLPDSSIIESSNPKDAAIQASRSIADGKAQIIMKGLVSTGDFLKAIIKKDVGLIRNNLLSHIAFIESPYYHKIICVTDAAMNISPDIDSKIKILNNAIKAYHKLGIKEPKVAVIAAVETINTKMEATIHASLLASMNKRRQIENCIIDGPLALDNAISRVAAEQKNIDSPIAGEADILLMPEINSGNILYKSLNFLGGGKSAAVIMGAKVPVVLTSRADSHDSKFHSIALASALN